MELRFRMLLAGVLVCTTLPLLCFASSREDFLKRERDLARSLGEGQQQPPHQQQDDSIGQTLSFSSPLKPSPPPTHPSRSHAQVAQSGKEMWTVKPWQLVVATMCLAGFATFVGAYVIHLNRDRSVSAANLLAQLAECEHQFREKRRDSDSVDLSSDLISILHETAEVVLQLAKVDTGDDNIPTQVLSTLLWELIVNEPYTDAIQNLVDSNTVATAIPPEEYERMCADVLSRHDVARFRSDMQSLVAELNGQGGREGEVNGEGGDLEIELSDTVKEKLIELEARSRLLCVDLDPVLQQHVLRLFKVEKQRALETALTGSAPLMLSGTSSSGLMAVAGSASVGMQARTARNGQGDEDEDDSDDSIAMELTAGQGDQPLHDGSSPEHRPDREQRGQNGQVQLLPAQVHELSVQVSQHMAGLVQSMTPPDATMHSLFRQAGVLMYGNASSADQFAAQMTQTYSDQVRTQLALKAAHDREVRERREREEAQKKEAKRKFDRLVRQRGDDLLKRKTAVASEWLEQHSQLVLKAVHTLTIYTVALILIVGWNTIMSRKKMTCNAPEQTVQTGWWVPQYFQVNAWLPSVSSLQHQGCLLWLQFRFWMHIPVILLLVCVYLLVLVMAGPGTALPITLLLSSCFMYDFISTIVCRAFVLIVPATIVFVWHSAFQMLLSKRVEVFEGCTQQLATKESHGELVSVERELTPTVKGFSLYRVLNAVCISLLAVLFTVSALYMSGYLMPSVE
eukprot:m.288625 g.288625  ORF g.288625 m.288625 type:complete len:739 (-) comp15805_c0_seq9:862-3078(-)